MIAASRNGVGEPPYEVIAVRYGTVEATRGVFLRDDVSGKDAEAPLRLDYFFWVIRNCRRTIVVDSGFSRDAGAARGRTMLRDPSLALADLPEAEDAEALLLTHLHYDHTGNLGMAGDAPILVGGREFSYWMAEREREERQGGLLEPEDLGHLDSLREEGRVCLLFDQEMVAPGVRATCVGGHTPGQIVLEVAGVGGPVLLASDALHLYEELDGSCLFADTVDVDAARRAVERLRELTELGARLIPGHDPLVAERYPELADGVYRVC